MKGRQRDGREGGWHARPDRQSEARRTDGGQTLIC